MKLQNYEARGQEQVFHVVWAEFEIRRASWLGVEGEQNRGKNKLQLKSLLEPGNIEYWENL